MAAVRHAMETGANAPTRRPQAPSALEELVGHADKWKSHDNRRRHLVSHPMTAGRASPRLGAPALTEPPHQIIDLAGATGGVPAQALSALFTWWLAGDLGSVDRVTGRMAGNNAGKWSRDRKSVV